MGVLGGTEVARYIVRCPDGNHLGYPYWDKVILIFVMLERNCIMYLIIINLKLIKVKYLNIQIKLY